MILHYRNAVQVLQKRFHNVVVHGASKDAISGTRECKYPARENVPWTSFTGEGTNRLQAYIWFIFANKIKNNLQLLQYGKMLQTVTQAIGWHVWWVGGRVGGWVGRWVGRITETIVSYVSSSWDLAPALLAHIKCPSTPLPPYKISQREVLAQKRSRYYQVIYNLNEPCPTSYTIGLWK